MLFLIFFTFFNFYLCGSDLATGLNKIVQLDGSLFVNKNAFEIYNKFGIYGVAKYFSINRKKISINIEKRFFYKKYEKLEGENETLIENYPKYLVFSFGEKKFNVEKDKKKNNLLCGLKNLQIGILKNALREAILEGIIKNDYDEALEFIKNKGRELGMKAV